MALTTANIAFNASGTPVASEFDDVYFSNDNGLNETRYVFIQNNQLLERWVNWDASRFVIAETGFGTGLNFLAAWQSFDEFKQSNPNSSLQTLHFITFEKFPLVVADLQKALTQWPELEYYSQQLVKQYPSPLPGCHRLHFHKGSVVLDIWMGDVSDSLPELINANASNVDAWFLDGFAPSKNPDMWTDMLYRNMAQLSVIGTTVATFTAAGAVRRGLISAGFTMEKRKGFGKKREMLGGTLTSLPTPRILAPYYVRSSLAPNVKTVAVVGGGIAAACCCYALVTRGFNVQLICQDKSLAEEASGNRQGGFYPQLQSQFNPPSALHAHSFLFARRFYNAINEQAPFQHQWCGVLQLAFNDGTFKRYQKVISCGLWSNDWLQWLSPEDSTIKANIPIPFSAMYFPDGGWIDVADLTSSITAAAEKQGNLSIQLNSSVKQLSHHNDRWNIQFSDHQTMTADSVVLACGADTELLQSCCPIPLMPVRGQVEYPMATPETSALKAVLCHKGYMTPSRDGRHTVGSSYIKHDRDTDYRSAEQNTIETMTRTALANCDWIHDMQFDEQGRASVRCTSPDHLPVVGAVPDMLLQQEQYSGLSVGKKIPADAVGFDRPNLYTLTSLGSRGLCTAPLMAELLASQMNNEALPVSTMLANSVNPNRFLVRCLKRSEDYLPDTK